MCSLAELAYLADAPPKWVLNTCAAVAQGEAYSLELARRLHVARGLQRALALPIANAYALAGEVERAIEAGEVTFTPPPHAAAPFLSLQFDLVRLASSFAVRRAALRTTIAPRTRGRPSRSASSPLAAAEAWGLDLSLLRANLRRTPAQRLRQLDAMVDFRRRVQRVATAE
jgi:hypothetical protein